MTDPAHLSEDETSVRAGNSHVSQTVRRWRARFDADGIDGVGVIAPGRGRKPEIPQATVDAIVDDTLHSVPDDGSPAS